jgi:site-specific DNA-methyltransferase (adenine-specific)
LIIVKISSFCPKSGVPLIPDDIKERVRNGEKIHIDILPHIQGFAKNAAKWGVAGLNIDGGRIETNGESLNGGTYSGNTPKKLGDIYGEFNKLKPDDFVSPKGRWPANVLHDGSDEVEAEFAKAGVSGPTGRLNSVGKIYNQNGQIYGKRNPTSFKGIHLDTGTPSRYFAQCPPDPTQHPEAARFTYCPKAPPSERSTPGNNHPTQKTLSLIRYLAKLTRTPTGGIVLDPFAGSGTTALACIAEGRDYILIEKEPEYAEICRRRIAEYTGQEITPKEIELADNQKVKQMSLW